MVKALGKTPVAFKAEVYRELLQDEALLDRMSNALSETDRKVEAIIIDGELVRLDFHADKPATGEKKYTPLPDMHIWLQEFRAAGYDTWKKLVDAGITTPQAPAAAAECAKASAAYADAMLREYKKKRDEQS